MKIDELIKKYRSPVKMETPVCFLSGGMTGLTKEERSEWRDQVQIDGVLFINPTVYDPDNLDPDYQQRGYEYCLNGIVNCDIVVVNLNNQKSVGTAQEIMLAWLLDKPIIGLYNSDEFLHPWYKNKLTSLFDNIGSLRFYLKSWAYKERMKWGL